jgi:hypothetical protein
MTAFPPDDPGREDETPAQERADEEQSSVDESIPDTPAEDPGAADAQLADETPDDAETTPLEDARTVEAETRPSTRKWRRAISPVCPRATSSPRPRQLLVGPTDQSQE